MDQELNMQDNYYETGIKQLYHYRNQNSTQKGAGHTQTPSTTEKTNQQTKSQINNKTIKSITTTSG